MSMHFRTRFQQVLLAAALTLTAGGALAAPPTYRLHVDGLACPFCAYGVEKKLGAIEGVERLETDIKAGTVTIIMKDGVRLDEASARQAVKAAGFTPGRFEELRSAGRGGEAK